MINMFPVKTSGFVRATSRCAYVLYNICHVETNPLIVYRISLNRMRTLNKTHP